MTGPAYELDLLFRPSINEIVIPHAKNPESVFASPPRRRLTIQRTRRTVWAWGRPTATSYSGHLPLEVR
jgi:hypothetical protein